MTTGNAIANNPKSDKAPDAVAVTLNDDLNRITSKDEDLANVQWKATVTGTETIKLTKTPKENESNSDSLLCIITGSKTELRVNTADGNSNNAFDISENYLHMKIDSKDYYVGVSSSFMSTSWKVAEDKNDVKDTEIAFFVKSSKPDIVLQFPFRNYEADFHQGGSSFTKPELRVEPTKTVSFSSDNTGVAEVASDGAITLKKRGTAKISVSFDGDAEHNEYNTWYILRVDDSALPGSRAKPFTPEQAAELAKEGKVTVEGTEVTLEAGCCYFIQGIVSKVSNPLSDMMGGMEIPGMEDMDLDGMNFPGMGSGGTSYFISNDGTTENQLKVLNGNKLTDNDGNGGIGYEALDSKSIGVGDVILVYGPLVYTEDKSSMPGGGGGGGDEPKYSAKVDEVNYIRENGMLRRLTQGSVRSMLTHTSKTLPDFYTLNENEFLGFSFTHDGGLAVTMKSSDEEIAKWVKNEEGTDSVFTAQKEGTVKVTVSMKVTLVNDDPDTDDNEERSYTMKCKYEIDVTTRDVEPMGLKEGYYELINSKNIDSLLDGDKLLIVANTDDKHYALGTSDAQMGGREGKEISLKEEDDKAIPDSINNDDVPDGTQIVTLEKDGEYWRFLAGSDEGKKLYLYISDPESSGGFDISSLMGSGAKIKKDNIDAIGDSCQLTLSLVSDSIKIKYNFTREKDGKEEAKNVMKYSSSSYSSSFGGFVDSEEKGMLLHLYRFVPAPSFSVGFDPVSEWRTIVSGYNVELGDGLRAFVAIGFKDGQVIMEEVTSPIKANTPYLLYGSKGYGDYQLTKYEGEVSEPSVNLLKISDEKTEGKTNDEGGSTVYVLSKKGGNVGFYKWTGGLLGAGRVYLSEEDVTPSSTAPSYISFTFAEGTTGIKNMNVNTGNNHYYTLDGRCLSGVPTQRGLYILNGKKVLIP